MNKRHYEHTLPNIRGSLSNTYVQPEQILLNGRIESYQHVAGYLVRFHMPDHLFQAVGQIQPGQIPRNMDVLLHLHPV